MSPPESQAVTDVRYSHQYALVVNNQQQANEENELHFSGNFYLLGKYLPKKVGKEEKVVQVMVREVTFINGYNY